MKQRRSLLQLLLILFALIITSCTQVPNVPICKELTPTKGYCVYTISGDSFYVSDDLPYDFKGDGKKMTWWEARPIMLAVPPNSWVKLKAYIIKICKKTGKCKNNIGEWISNKEISK